MSNSMEASHTSITKPASKVMLGGILSLLGSLASNVIVAAVFGAKADMDAYLTAMVIPTYFQLALYSSLSFVLVPAFIELQTKEGKDNAWAFVGTFFWLTTVTLLSISIIGSLFSAQIIGITAPGFQEEKAALASQMLSVLIFVVPLSGLGTMTVGIQNARNRFFLPSVAPAFGALGNVIVLLILNPLVGSMSLAWGYLASTLVQAGFTTLPVILYGWKKVLPITDPRIVGILKLTLPIILFSMLNSFSPVAERYFSSVLPDGQISYMGYVNKVANIFVVLLASGIATSILPSMARAFAQNGIQALSERNSFGLRLSLAVALPGVLITSAVAVPLIGVLFERGAFEHADTIGVSLIVFPFFLRDILFRMIGNVLQRSFYVLKDTTTQLLTTTVFLILYIAAAGFFVAHWGYIGLIWAGTLKRGLAVVVIWMLLSRRFPKSEQGNIFPHLLKYGCAAIVAYVCGHFIVMEMSSTPAVFQLMAGGFASSLLYLAILYFMDNEILRAIVDLSGIHLIIGKVHTGSKKLFLNRL